MQVRASCEGCDRVSCVEGEQRDVRVVRKM